MEDGSAKSAVTGSNKMAPDVAGEKRARHEVGSGADQGATAAEASMKKSRTLVPASSGTAPVSSFEAELHELQHDLEQQKDVGTAEEDQRWSRPAVPAFDPAHDSLGRVKERRAHANFCL